MGTLDAKEGYQQRHLQDDCGVNSRAFASQRLTLTFVFLYFGKKEVTKRIITFMLRCLLGNSPET